MNRKFELENKNRRKCLFPLVVVCTLTILSEVCTSSSAHWMRANAAQHWSKRWGHAAVVFDDKIWVLGGSTYAGYDNVLKPLNDVWFSDNGGSWMQATAAAGWSPREGHTTLVFKNRMWVFGGSVEDSDVWSSTDGMHWVQETPSAPWSPRANHASLVYDNMIWILGGGIGNDVWSSKDGSSWTQITPSAPWSKRYGHGALVFDDKIWILGGWGGFETVAQDIWSSPDGVRWVLMPTTNTDAVARMNTAVVVYKDKMWRLGGVATGYTHPRSNDVWCSPDGGNWTRWELPAEWSPRGHHAAVVFKDKIWVLGGRDQSGALLNDIWYLDLSQAGVPRSLWVLDGFGQVQVLKPNSEDD